MARPSRAADLSGGPQPAAAPLIGRAPALGDAAENCCCLTSRPGGNPSLDSIEDIVPQVSLILRQPRQPIRPIVLGEHISTFCLRARYIFAWHGSRARSKIPCDPAPSPSIPAENQPADGALILAPRHPPLGDRNGRTRVSAATALVDRRCQPVPGRRGEVFACACPDGVTRRFSTPTNPLAPRAFSPSSRGRGGPVPPFSARRPSASPRPTGVGCRRIEAGKGRAALPFF